MKRLLIRLIIAISFVGIVMLSQYVYVHHVKENPSDPGEEISYPERPSKNSASFNRMEKVVHLMVLYTI